MPVIPAPGRLEAGGLQVQSQPGLYIHLASKKERWFYKILLSLRYLGFFFTWGWRGQRRKLI
jgi:hypothetical protein